MTATELVSQQRQDGSVDAWLDGWHIRFPPDEGRPRVARGSPPTSLPDPQATIEATPFASGRAVRSGSWIVEVTESAYTVLPTDPEDDDSDHHYHYYRI